MSTYLIGEQHHYKNAMEEQSCDQSCVIMFLIPACVQVLQQRKLSERSVMFFVADQCRDQDLAGLVGQKTKVFALALAA